MTGFWGGTAKASAGRGAFYPRQLPRDGFVDSRATVRSVPVITTLGGLEDRQEQQLITELELWATNQGNGGQ